MCIDFFYFNDFNIMGIQNFQNVEIGVVLNWINQCVFVFFLYSVCKQCRYGIDVYLVYVIVVQGF